MVFSVQACALVFACVRASEGSRAGDFDTWCCWVMAGSIVIIGLT